MAFFALVERSTTQSHTLVNRAAVADFGCLADHDAHGVVKKHALADLRAGVNLYAREKAADVRDTSLTLSPGIEGVVVNTEVFQRTERGRNQRLIKIKKKMLFKKSKNTTSKRLILLKSKKKRN